MHLVSLLTGATVKAPNGASLYIRQLFYDQATQCPGGAASPCAESGTIPGHDANYGTGFTARGNVTTDQQWWNANGPYPNYPYHLYAYDIAGNVRGHQDPNGNVTTYAYTDGSYAQPNTITNPKGQTTSITYDGSTQKPTYVTDADGVVTGYFYNDPLDRLTDQENALSGSSAISHVKYLYENPIWKIQYVSQTSGWDLHSDDFYDGGWIDHERGLFRKSNHDHRSSRKGTGKLHE